MIHLKVKLPAKVKKTKYENISVLKLFKSTQMQIFT